MELNLSSLNESQHAAVLDTEGAVLVFAGAGSGKTRVLTHRVAYLISQGVPAYNVLAITFTNKAAKEMQERIEQMLGDIGSGVWVSTFHSFCAKVLYVHAEKLGYTQSFSILDESGALRMLKRVLREKHLDDKDTDKYRSHISTAKNAGMAPDDYNREIKLTEKEADFICGCYERYNEVLKENNAMDFDDLQIKALELFNTYPDVLLKYSRKFRYIHVDEFQDTNNVQLELVKLLCGYWKNIFVVGDDDQSIYSWRGANIRNILDFEKLFENVKIHKLMQNYRSTGAILQAANNVIKNNEGRYEKTLFTASGNGVRVEFQTCFNEHQEAKWVLENIKNLIYYNNYKLSDFAILTRVNALSRLYELKLQDVGYGYVILGGFRFFERREILDVLAYLKILVNPSDSDAILRVINLPAREIGDVTQQKLLDYCRETGMRLFDLIMGISDAKGISESIKNKVGKFRDIIGDLIFAKEKLSINGLVNYLVEKVEFEKYYTASPKADEADRWENVKELVKHVEELGKKNPGYTLDEFLKSVTLDTDRQSGDDDKVTIATMHSAKGLEFRAVFIVGCDEGILPSERSLKQGGLEEERRVMYVAVTRAKERLYITSAVQRGYGSSGKGPSRFFFEAKGEKKEQKNIEKKESERYGNEYYKNIDYEQAMPLSKREEISESATRFVESKAEKRICGQDTGAFKRGMRVEHPRYGEGIITDIQGEGMTAAATVIFKGLGMKKFSLSAAPLKLLN